MEGRESSRGPDGGVEVREKVRPAGRRSLARVLESQQSGICKAKCKQDSIVALKTGLGTHGDTNILYTLNDTLQRVCVNAGASVESSKAI